MTLGTIDIHDKKYKKRIGFGLNNKMYLSLSEEGYHVIKKINTPTLEHRLNNIFVNK